MSDTIDQKPLSQYLTDAIEPLKSGELTTTDFVKGLFQYTEGKAYFVKNPDIANAIFSQEDPAQAKEIATNIAENPFSFLAMQADKNQDNSYQKVEALKILGGKFPESDLPAVPVDAFQKKLQEQLNKSKKHRAYVSSLVAQYGKNLRKEQRDAALQEFLTPTRATSLDEAKKEYAERIRSSPTIMGDERAIQKFNQAINEATEELVIPARTQRVVQEYINHPDSPPELVDGIISKTFTGVESDPVRAARIQHSATIQKPSTKDISLNTAFPEYPKGIKAEDAINHAFNTRVASLDPKKIEHIAKKAVGVSTESEILHVVERAKQEAIEKSGGALHHKVDQMVLSTAHEKQVHGDDIENYLIGVYKRGAGAEPNASGFFSSVAHANHPEHFHFEFHVDLGGWALKTGTRQLQKTVVSGGTGKAAKRLGVAFLTKIGFNATSKFVTWFGGPVGLIIYGVTVIFPGILKKVGGATIGKLAEGGFSSIQAAGGAIASVVQNMLGTQYKDPNEHNAAMLALALAVTPFLLVFFLTMSNLYTQRAQFTPINSGNIGGGGVPVDCTQEPDKSSPACNLTKCVVKKPGDCQWPIEKTSGACIIEGPFVGTHSRCRLSGIDFISRDANQAGLFGAKVFTPYAGSVEVAVFGFDDYSGREGSQDGGTYGNHVIVKTTDGGRLMFAHLRDIQTVKMGDAVESGDVVGFVDSTGYSLGVHLHYEDIGPSRDCPRTGADINKYTPFPIPPCEGFSDCDAKLKAMGQAACLSEMP